MPALWLATEGRDADCHYRSPPDDRRDDDRAVLLQKSEGGGLGVGGGAGFMSSRGTANLLTRTTAVLAVGFFITSLLLSWLASYDRKPSSIIDGNPASQSQPRVRRRRYLRRPAAAFWIR